MKSLKMILLATATYAVADIIGMTTDIEFIQRSAMFSCGAIYGMFGSDIIRGGKCQQQ